ncbi:MAG: DNA mismatch repair protein MutS [Candidatus Zixiibacteriota bacterium]|nr:MAG: DNA mismatch repair protein MutS [candidate division Zixibacteria bacterium]
MDPKDEPTAYPIDGTLDLHLFAPRDTHEVVTEYIRICLEKNIMQLRIIHGKGIGVKRRIVHSILESHPNVISFRHEEGSGGSWGATVADLRPTASHNPPLRS